MSAEPAELIELRRRAREISDLNGIGGLLLWDQNTMMPPGGAGARADQFEALERIQHDRLADPGLAKLLDALEPWAASADPDSDGAGLVRVLRRDHHKAVQVPTELAAEISSAAARAQQAWLEAREKGDFKRFAPALERVLELQSRYIA
jgi:carboxypeptidase Taq